RSEYAPQSGRRRRAASAENDLLLSQSARRACGATARLTRKKNAGREGFEPSKAPYGILTGLANPRTRPTMRPPREVTKPKASLPVSRASGERRSVSSSADRDDVRDRRERDLFRRLRSNVQTDGRVHARERAIGDPGSAQLVEHTAGVAAASHHPEVRRVREQKDAQRGLRELAIVSRDHDVALRPETQAGELGRASHHDVLIRIRRVRRTDRDDTDAEAKYLADLGERPRDRTGADHDQLRPCGRARDRFARRERPDLHPDPRGLVPVVTALEADALLQRAHRVALTGIAEPVAAQAAETRAACDDPECHAFARGRASLEAGHRHQGRTLAAFEGFAHCRSRIHNIRIERGPVVMSTTEPPL